MSYWNVADAVERSPGRVETKLSDGAKLSPPDGIWTVALAALVGYIPVVPTVRPADTPTHTTDRSITLPGGVPTETWTSRVKSSGELAGDTQNTNQADLIAKANAALTANANFLAIGAAPTNVQVRDHVIVLTRENSGVIKLLLARLFGDATKLDSTTGT